MQILKKYEQENPVHNPQNDFNYLTIDLTMSTISVFRVIEIVIIY